jgi:hypothetical protein
MSSTIWQSRLMPPGPERKPGPGSAEGAALCRGAGCPRVIPSFLPPKAVKKHPSDLDWLWERSQPVSGGFFTEQAIPSFF